MIVVSNSGPIISFARASSLELLQQVLQEIKIPAAVYEEIVLYGGIKPGSAEIKDANWIKRGNVKNMSLVNELPLSLGRGGKRSYCVG